jgi:site-specific recombinase XerD
VSGDPEGPRGPGVLPDSAAADAPPRVPKLLDQLRLALRTRHYSIRTEDAYAGWARRFILFHGKRHPADMGAAEVVAFLSDLAHRGGVSASTQNQALSALLFLYRVVLDRELEGLDGTVRASTPRRLPMVLARDEVRGVLRQLEGVSRIMATLLYGSGLRLMDCLRLRVRDVNFRDHLLLIREGKGRKDRAAVLPRVVEEPLCEHLACVRTRHQKDRQAGEGRVRLPYALARKMPNATAITSIPPFCSARSAVPGSRRVSRGASPATSCATLSPPTCSRTAPTSEPSRNCSATEASRPP